MPSTKQLDYKALDAALVANGALSGAQVEFGGEGNKPPPPFSGAFAFFEPGDAGKSPRFVVLDASDPRWKEKDRYTYLKEIKWIPPFEEEGFQTRWEATFSQDRASKRFFVSLFDRVSRRSYLFEGEQAMDALALLTAPKPRQDRDILIHPRLAELERLLRQGVKRNG